MSIANTTNNVQVLGERLALFVPTYAPSNARLTPEAIEALHAQAVAANTNVEEKENENSIDIYNRHLAFDDLPVFATRFINALEACGASEDTVNHARTFVNKIQGKASKGKKKKERDNENKGADNKFVSDSQRSYPKLIEHYQILVIIGENEPLYNPSSDDLKTAGMRIRLDSMVATNSAFNKSDAAAKMARLERNALFNTKTTGLVDTCFLAKNEVKATFGGTSPQYYMISSLEFHRIKER
ncbi:hypothetical protein M0G43_12550 [Subsaxibacter sp. CAU 1640]|uniref:hypothetical protein n=1 Tax=Subsaxibacter sp. CAU 1640 TaxID=2933271 RepID=UPI00200311B1|nr:hypothetical protein [Subsaxibacter sp. CAU 1640]MCK7591408.1 hypothetical protein [Subsaxibacter sp. CAU 1640]